LLCELYLAELTTLGIRTEKCSRIYLFAHLKIAMINHSHATTNNIVFVKNNSASPELSVGREVLFYTVQVFCLAQQKAGSSFSFCISL
jgi:hypothetical protein